MCGSELCSSGSGQKFLSDPWIQLWIIHSSSRAQPYMHVCPGSSPPWHLPVLAACNLSVVMVWSVVVIPYSPPTLATTPSKSLSPAARRVNVRSATSHAMLLASCLSPRDHFATLTLSSMHCLPLMKVRTRSHELAVRPASNLSSTHSGRIFLSQTSS